MHFSNIGMIALAAFASAAPMANEHRGHAHKHLARDSIAGRSISRDGSCGSWSGASCAPGFCCGSNGWCGNSYDHCGAGCQSDFGQCGPGVASGSSGSPSTVAASSISQVSVSPPRYSAPPGLSHGAPASTFATSASSVKTEQPSAPPAYTTSAAATTSSVAQTSAAASSPQASSQSPEAPSSYAPPTSSAAPTTSSAAPTTSSAAPSSYGGASSTSSSNGPSQTEGSTYGETYKGDGSESSGWPSQSDWLSFDDLFEINKPIMKESCANFGQADNSDEEIDNIKSSIEDVSSETGVDKAFVLAMMMQESNGCVRVKTTSYSHANPGLFQSHEGKGSCNDGTSGAQNPCPESEIHQMIEDSVAGTDSGDGLKQLLEKAKGQGSQKYYEVARMYNSGSIDASGNLGMGVATHCYCSDIANRLTGWSKGNSGCDSATVGN